MFNIRTYVNVVVCIATDAIAVMERDDSTILTSSHFDVKNFFRSKLPGVVSASELSDVFIAADLNKFGSKGMYVFCMQQY